MNYSQKDQTKLTGGFTLIEMLVSSAFFAIAMLVIVSSLISLEAASRKARVIRVAVDNVGAAIDSMSRTIRMGSAFHCGCGLPYTTPNDCEMSNPNGAGYSSCFAFEGQNGDPANAGDQIIYKESGQRILRSVDGGTTWVYMTAPEISITKLHFYVGGSTVASDQPYVTMLVSGIATTTTGRADTPFDIQTTISARTPNIDLNP